MFLFFSHAKSIITVKCLKDEHTWDTTWDYLKQGNWCPRCSGKILKTYDEMVDFVSGKGGVIISAPQQFMTSSKLNIQCLKCNYEWKVSYNSIVYNGSWCPRCAKKVLKTYDEVKCFVESKSGILLSDSTALTRNTSKLNIQCAKGHKWFVSYANLISNKRWCPTCNLGAEQAKLATLISEIVSSPYTQNFKGFEWLKDKRKLEIDIWFPELKLAVEYDGPHHFKPIFYGTNRKKALASFEDRKRKDAIKNSLIQQHPEEVKHFIRFHFKEKIDRVTVENKLKKLGVLNG